MSDVVIVTQAGITSVVTTSTISGSGSSFSPPSGTGFIHVTGGVMDAAARAVNLATADVTGVLPYANLQFGSPSGANQVPVSSGAGAAAWAALSGITVGGVTPGTAGQVYITNSTPASVWTGLVSVELTHGRFTSGGNVGESYITIGPWVGGATDAAIWALPTGTSIGSNNYAYLSDGTNTWFNAPGNLGVLHFYQNNATNLGNWDQNALYLNSGVFRPQGTSVTTWPTLGRIQFSDHGGTGVDILGLEYGGTTYVGLAQDANSLFIGSDYNFSSPVASVYMCCAQTGIIDMVSNGYGSVWIFDRNGSFGPVYSLIAYDTTAAPVFYQRTPATDAATNNMTLRAQYAYAGASTHVVAGSLVFDVGPPISGTTEAAFQFTRNAVTIAQLGYDHFAETDFWLLASGVAPSTSNMAVVSNGTSFTYLNTSGSGAIAMYSANNAALFYIPTTQNAAYFGGSTTAAPLGVSWATSTTPTLLSGTSATAFTIGTDKTGASLILAVDANTTLWTCSLPSGGQMQASATLSALGINWAAASGAPGTFTITGQNAGGTNDGGALSLGGGNASGSSKAAGSVKVTTPFNPGYVAIAAATTITATAPQSNANVINITGTFTGAVALNLLREIADTSIIIVRNSSTNGTITVSYLSGGTAGTIATGTAWIIQSDGSNLQKICQTT